MNRSTLVAIRYTDAISFSRSNCKPTVMCSTVKFLSLVTLLVVITEHDMAFCQKEWKRESDGTNSTTASDTAGTGGLNNGEIIAMAIGIPTFCVAVIGVTVAIWQCWKHHKKPRGSVGSVRAPVPTNNDDQTDFPSNGNTNPCIGPTVPHNSRVSPGDFAPGPSTKGPPVSMHAIAVRAIVSFIFECCHDQVYKLEAAYVSSWKNSTSPHRTLCPGMVSEPVPTGTDAPDYGSTNPCMESDPPLAASDDPLPPGANGATTNGATVQLHDLGQPLGGTTTGKMSMKLDVKNILNVLHDPDIDFADADWEVLSQQLMRHSALRTIKADRNGDPGLCLIDTASQWLQTDLEASWGKLAKAIENLQRYGKKTANAVQQKAGTGQSRV